MEISQYDLQDGFNTIPVTGVPTAQALERSGWFSGTAVGRYQEAELAVFPWKIGDKKAVQMYRLYASQDIFISLDAFRTQRLLVLCLFNNIFQNIAKRSFDLLIAFLMLPFVLPIMLCAAILIKLDSSGPIIFKQQRVGKWGRRFNCYKFRSMCSDAENKKAELGCFNEADDVIFKIKRDPRITRIGRIIRKLSIDELPQIFNVIKGDMSLVGPRPPVPCEVDQYSFDVFRRLDAVPGITGLQQVSGRSDLTFKRWVELDLEYIRSQSLKKDIEILLLTVPAVISGKGAY